MEKWNNLQFQLILIVYFNIFQIEMKFTEPFFGLAYADFDRNSACQVLGKGELSVRLELPLKGCGTKQVTFSSSSLLVNIHQRFSF